MKGRIAIIKRKLEQKNEEILNLIEKNNKKEAEKKINQLQGYTETLVDLQIMKQERQEEIINELKELI